MKKYIKLNLDKFLKAAIVIIIAQLIMLTAIMSILVLIVHNGNAQDEVYAKTPVISITPDTDIIETPIYYDIPFSHELQDLVRAAADEAGIDIKLALAVIYKESSYKNIMGDGGDSYGYMQIQKKWHEKRMEKLGVTDLMDPLSNFRVGCDLLAAHLSWCSLEDALTMYNTGHTGPSKYAESVIKYMKNIKEEKEWENTQVHAVTAVK